MATLTDDELIRLTELSDAWSYPEDAWRTPYGFMPNAGLAVTELSTLRAQVATLEADITRQAETIVRVAQERDEADKRVADLETQLARQGEERDEALEAMRLARLALHIDDAERATVILDAAASRAGIL